MLTYIDFERNGVLVLSLTGRITLGEPTKLLRQLIADALDLGRKDIIINLGEVVHIDSSGLGELVTSHLKVSGRGGRLKLAQLTARTQELVHLTKLYTVFEIFPDDDSALASFL